MNRKGFCILLAMVLCIGLAPAFGNAAGSAATGEYKDRHYETTWNDTTATHITFTDSGATVSGSGASASGTTVTINQAGTYVFTGSCSDGQILVTAGANDKVVLVLNGLTLACQSSSPLYVQEADEARILLAEGSVNTFADSANYVWPEGEDEPDAVIFSKVDLAICGSGALYVTGLLRNGIATKDDLIITGGTIVINAVYDGLRGRDSISIAGGDFTITAGNDGIKSNNDTAEDKGWIIIDGGTFHITSGCDGIQAETSLTINGGAFTITAGGGSAAAPQRANETMGGRGGNMWGSQNVTATQDDTGSVKGLKATTVFIHGGAFTLDCADDALHANGDMTITGGSMTISTGDDGAHADGALLVTGGAITILSSYEGLEGATVEITGGDIALTASDDGINAAGGTDGSGTGGMFGRDSFRTGGNSSYAIIISGGAIWVNAGGDGLDSNGNLTISGGTVEVNGPTSAGNSALDCDGLMNITGGTVIAAGAEATDQMGSQSFTQAVLTISYSSLPAGTTLTLYNAAGEALASFTTFKQAQAVLFSTPAMAVGGTYTVETSTGISTQATLSSASTTVSQSGAASGGGMGVMGGGGRR